MDVGASSHTSNKHCGFVDAYEGFPGKGIHTSTLLTKQGDGCLLGTWHWMVQATGLLDIVLKYLQQEVCSNPATACATHMENKSLDSTTRTQSLLIHDRNVKFDNINAGLRRQDSMKQGIQIMQSYPASFIRHPLDMGHSTNSWDT